MQTEKYFLIEDLVSCVLPPWIFPDSFEWLLSYKVDRLLQTHHQQPASLCSRMTRLPSIDLALNFCKTKKTIFSNINFCVIKNTFKSVFSFASNILEYSRLERYFVPFASISTHTLFCLVPARKLAQVHWCFSITSVWFHDFDQSVLSHFLLIFQCLPMRSCKISLIYYQQKLRN